MQFVLATSWIRLVRDQVKKAVYIVQQFILAKKTIFGILAIQRFFLRVTNHSKNFVFRCDKNMRGVFSHCDVVWTQNLNPEDKNKHVGGEEES